MSIIWVLIDLTKLKIIFFNFEVIYFLDYLTARGKPMNNYSTARRKSMNKRNEKNKF